MGPFATASPRPNVIGNQCAVSASQLSTPGVKLGSKGAFNQ